MKILWCVAFALTVLAASPGAAQQGQNIAGLYRGQMTSCLSRERSAECRKGFVELIRLADDVDAKRAEWDRARAGGAGSAAKFQEDHAEALVRLDRAVADFNRNTDWLPVQSK